MWLGWDWDGGWEGVGLVLGKRGWDGVAMGVNAEGGFGLLKGIR